MTTGAGEGEASRRASPELTPREVSMDTPSGSGGGATSPADIKNPTETARAGGVAAARVGIWLEVDPHSLHQRVHATKCAAPRGGGECGGTGWVENRKQHVSDLRSSRNWESGRAVGRWQGMRGLHFTCFI